jgi:hypothetical protein
LEGQTELVYFPLQLEDFFRSAYHFVLDAVSHRCVQKFPENESRLLILIVVFNALFHVFEQVDVGAEEVGQCFGRSRDALLLELVSAEDGVDAVAGIGGLAVEPVPDLLSEVVFGPVLEVLRDSGRLLWGKGHSKTSS